MTFAPRPPKGGSKALSQKYVPTGMQQAMNQHMQNTAPAHLKKYVGTGAYVPQHAQKALAEHMQKSMPGHMQQYSGAYLQQNMVAPGTIRPDVNSGGRPAVGPAPLPDKLNLSHTGAVSTSQYEAKFYNNLFAAGQPAPQGPGQQTGQQFQPLPQQPQLPPVPGPNPYAQDPQAGQPPTHQQTYGFIMNPEQPKRKGFSFGGGSTPIKLLAVLIVVLLLALAANAARGVLGADNSNTAQLISVAQDQQSILHLTSQVQEQQMKGLTTPAQNFTVTANLSLTSQQTELLSYMKQNGKKVKSKQLALKVDPTLDTRLKDAAAAGTLDTTYKEVMTTQLNSYKLALQQAYAHTKGPNGRALLTKEFNSAELLLTQLNAN